MIDDKKRKRIIGGKEFVSPSDAAKILGCSRSTLDRMMALSKTGRLRPPLSWYRDLPKAPIWFSTEFLVEWVRRRGEVHV